MALREEKLADLSQILSECGVPAEWKGRKFPALVSVPVFGEEFEVGGLVESVDFTVKILLDLFVNADLPKHGDRICFAGKEYRIVKVSSHSQYPALTLSVSSAHD